MDPLVLAAGYFDAWRRRDPDAIAAVLAEDGTFWDPAGDRSAAAVGAEARRLFERFPDLAFEPLGATLQSDGGVVGRWTMRRGAGDRVVRGADFLTVAGDRIAAVERYFDRPALTTAGGERETGTCVRIGSDRRGAPGAFGITWQEAPTEAGRQAVRGETERILAELPGTPGFIGGVAATVGDRFLTVTAWEEPNNPFALIREGTHRMAAVQFFGARLYSAGWTGVWTPTRLHPLWVRCPACRTMVDHARARGQCDCGVELPAAPAYW